MSCGNCRCDLASCPDCGSGRHIGASGLHERRIFLPVAEEDRCVTLEADAAGDFRLTVTFFEFGYDCARHETGVPLSRDELLELRRAIDRALEVG